MRTMGRVAASTGVVMAAVTALAACNGDDQRVSTTGTTTTTTEASSTTSTRSCVLEGADTTVETRAGPQDLSLLTGVRTGRQPCADRVVFDFRMGTPPGFTAEYQSGPFFFGESDEPVNLRGSAYLVVTFPRASGVDLSAVPIVETYSGPNSIVPSGLVHVREVRRLSDFEGVMVWVIGVDGMRPFTADVLDGPPRVYLDVG